MRKPDDERQLKLPLDFSPRLRVINGLGQKKVEVFASRDAVALMLLEAGADMLLRRISPERAEVIEQEVEEILDLFDLADRTPALFPVLQKKLDALAGLMSETREIRAARRRG